MSWSFHPPPGWPPQPAGWQPPPGWAPDPSWPPAPPGWQFWLPAGPAPAVPPPPGPFDGGGSAPVSLGAPWIPTVPAGHPGQAPRPWFSRWWTYPLLLVLLLFGGGAGYALTLLIRGDS